MGRPLKKINTKDAIQALKKERARKRRWANENYKKKQNEKLDHDQTEERGDEEDTL